MVMKNIRGKWGYGVRYKGKRGRNWELRVVDSVGFWKL